MNTPPDDETPITEIAKIEGLLCACNAVRVPDETTGIVADGMAHRYNHCGEADPAPAPTTGDELHRLASEIATSLGSAGCMIVTVSPTGAMEFGTVAQAGPGMALMLALQRGSIAIAQGAPVPGDDPPCHACQGSKRIAGRICLACGGKGTIPKATAPVVRRG